MNHALLAALEDGTLSVGVLGLGKAGHPLIVRFAQAGIPAVGFSTHPFHVEMTNNGSNQTENPFLPDNVRRLVFDCQLHGTTDLFYAVRKPLILLCLADLAAEDGLTVEQAARRYAEGIGTALQKGTTVLFVKPAGVTLPLASLTALIAAKAGLRAGQDFFTGLISADEVDACNPAALVRRAAQIKEGAE